MVMGLSYLNNFMVRRFPSGSEAAFSPRYPVEKINGKRTIVRATQQNGLKDVLASELGTPLGLGSPPDEIFNRLPASERDKLPRKGPTITEVSQL